MGPRDAELPLDKVLLSLRSVSVRWIQSRSVVLRICCGSAGTQMTTGSYLLSVYFSRGTAAKWKGTPMPTPRFPSTTLIATALAMTFLAASAHAHGGQHSHARLMVSGSAAPASIAQGSQRSTSKPITNPTTPAVPSSLATTITIAPITVGPPVLPLVCSPEAVPGVRRESGYFRNLERRCGDGTEGKVDGGDHRLLA